MKRITTTTKRDSKGNVIKITYHKCPDNRNCFDIEDDECEKYAVMSSAEYCNHTCIE